MCNCARAVTLVASPLVSWKFGEACVRGMILFIYLFLLKERKRKFFF